MQKEISDEINRIKQESDDLVLWSKREIKRLKKEKLDLINSYEARIKDLEHRLKSQRDEYERKLAVAQAIQADRAKPVQHVVEEQQEIEIKKSAPPPIIVADIKQSSLPETIESDSSGEAFDDSIKNSLLTSLIADRTRLLSSSFVTPDDEIIKMLDAKIQSLSV